MCVCVCLYLRVIALACRGTEKYTLHSRSWRSINSLTNCTYQTPKKGFYSTKSLIPGTGAKQARRKGYLSLHPNGWGASKRNPIIGPVWNHCSASDFGISINDFTDSNYPVYRLVPTCKYASKTVSVCPTRVCDTTER